MLLNYLARLNVLLKDVTPLVRLLMQFVFWGLPILYFPEGLAGKINALNPFYFPLELFRLFTITGHTFSAPATAFVPWLVFFITVNYLSKTRLNRLAADHL